jgi:hypothetical protein
MLSEFRYFLTCPKCKAETPEPDFARRVEQVCPCCNETKIEPRDDFGGGFDRYFNRVSLTSGRGNRFEVSACDACVDSGKAVAMLRALAKEQEKDRHG